MKLRRVNISETISRLLDRARFAKVAGKTLSIVTFILSSIRHVGGDIHQTGDRWIRSCLGDDRPAIAVTHENARPVLQSQDSLHRRDIVLERCFGLLDYGYVVAFAGENVIDTLPAGTVRPCAMD